MLHNSTQIFQYVSKDSLDSDLLDWIFTSFNPSNLSHVEKLHNIFKTQTSLENLLIYKILEELNQIKNDEFKDIFEKAQKEIEKINKAALATVQKSQKKQQEKNKPQKKIQETNEPKKVSAKKKDNLSKEYIEEVKSQQIPLRDKSNKILPQEGQRNILITSALPYVNNEPHLGNLIGAVLSADVYSRYCRLMGYNCVYICGTDEYGTATEVKALLSSKTPREICDQYFEIHKEIYENFQIDFDIFGRTSTDKHKDIVQEMFLNCRKNDFMLPQTQEQLYCQKCDRFLADRFVLGTCPFCQSEGATGDQCDACQKSYEGMQLLDPKCFICKELVSSKTSDHLYLNLEKLQPELQDFLDKSSNNNWTNNSIAITKSWLQEGLKPRCITRDLKWGVPVPEKDYENKCFYVWFDAPIGYISITANYTDEWKQWWQNPDNVELVQFMGKDNVPFHTVLFPGAQLASRTNWTKLTHINTTEYLNYEEIKFSKRNGTGVFGGDVLKIPEIGIELWRFYLLYIRPENSDSQFIWTDFQSAINNVMSNNIGNLIQRVLSYIQKNLSNKVPKFLNVELKENDEQLFTETFQIFDQYILNMEKQKLREGLKKAVKLGKLLNQYLQDTKFFTLKGEELNLKLGIVINLIRVLSALLEPFTPSLSAKINFLLQIEKNEKAGNMLKFLMENKNKQSFMSLIEEGHLIRDPVPLVNKIEDVSQYKQRFGFKQQ